MLVIVDYGMGNLGSIVNMLKRVGIAAILSSDTDVIAQAEKLILPGVGAFDNGMRNLNHMGLVDVLNQQVLECKIPILGICLGMQLLSQCSEEGQLSGLGWLDAETIRFRFDGTHDSLKVPHMGWNTVHTRSSHPLLSGLEENNRFYFVHSYHMRCIPESAVLGETEYGGLFTSVVACENIVGVQFHPEKSHKFGMRLLQNFVNWEWH